ncbi:MAG: Arc family DNA-binding protein [Candidatus Marinimicrobia bacterium]|nr:Arc family DNA-binding protein [Candidatus Neomarinimicrobiota bacterium]
MAKIPKTEMRVLSVRLPVRIWNIVRHLANKNYRSLNNQILKIFEDWFVEHGYMEETERTKFDE